MTNNPKKVAGLAGYGLEIAKSVRLQIKPNPHNQKYLQTKADKMGHDLPPNDPETEERDLTNDQDGKG